jgi:hypothetical protein
MRSMPPVPLPLFLAGTTHLNEHLAFECRQGQVTDFDGHLTVYTRAQAALAAFGVWTGQGVVKGSSSQGDIRRALGVRKVVVQRAVDNDRARGAAGLRQC